MRYPNASTEPLEIIRANECEADPSLTTKRFQALWNEIERLRSALADASVDLTVLVEAAKSVGNTGLADKISDQILKGVDDALQRSP
jgi:hypothetical protein